MALSGNSRSFIFGDLRLAITTKISNCVAFLLFIAALLFFVISVLRDLGRDNVKRFLGEIVVGLDF